MTPSRREVIRMTETKPGRAHLVAGGFPPGSMGGHDHDYARLRLLGLLAERDVPASVANDFADVEKWLPVSRLLITYVAGPYPDATQTRVIENWLAAGGHWLALHGTSGGRAQRVERQRMRRTVKSEHHALLGSMFLTHPPIREFRVDVTVPDSPLTKGLGASFVIEDEPYFVTLQDPGATQILLTADYGSSAASATVGLYERDTSLLADGKTRVLGYTRKAGDGGVTYFALGHCHNPAIRAARANADPADTTPPTFRGPWETDAFITLLRNAIEWGVA
jgi:type 1 glutamine amidotransferase